MSFTNNKWVILVLFREPKGTPDDILLLFQNSIYDAIIDKIYLLVASQEYKQSKTYLYSWRRLQWIGEAYHTHIIGILSQRRRILVWRAREQARQARTLITNSAAKVTTTQNMCAGGTTMFLIITINLLSFYKVLMLLLDQQRYQKLTK